MKKNSGIFIFHQWVSYPAPQRREDPVTRGGPRHTGRKFGPDATRGPENIQARYAGGKVRQTFALPLRGMKAKVEYHMLTSLEKP